MFSGLTKRDLATSAIEINVYDCDSSGVGYYVAEVIVPLYLFAVLRFILKFL